jgi:L-ribulose-5-phosphate 4-epimerase
MNESGIKFNCNWIKEKPLDIRFLKELNAWRDQLYALGFIGVYPDGIGYGNISIRFGRKKFIITGAATGKYKKLSAKHYTQVTGYDLSTNSLTTTGPIKASSESLTHAVIYECDKNINAVIHIHHSGLWKKLMNKAPTTDTIDYGTTALAHEIVRLFKQTKLAEQKIIVMAGHPEGIVCFGNNLAEAGEKIVDELNTLRQNA